MEITGVTYSVSHYEHYNQNNDKNYFEEIIDMMILDGISGMNDTFRNAIRNLDSDKKRMTILSLLDKDLNLFKRIKALTDKNINKMDHITDISKMLREYVKVADTLKRQYGEVMTPTELIKDMLGKLPKSVWSNPNLKWLDACNGVGPFLCVVIYGLMKGLRDWEPDEEKRYKHIVENMIYAGELQPKNQFLFLCAVDPFDSYGLNIYTGSFLEDGFDYHMKNVWSVDSFDIIIGNPPYDKSQKAEGKRGGGDTLWDKFVIKYLNKTLKKGGYLSLVHPTIWRKPQSEKSSSKEVNMLMLSKQIHYLEMHDSKDGLKTFNAGTRYDFYFLENCEIYTTTKINDEDGIITDVDLKGYNFIPNKGLDFFNKILAKSEDEKCPIIFNRTNYGSDRTYVVENRDENHIYKLVHSTPKSGNRYLFSSRNDRGHFGISKIIFGESGIYDVIVDMSGEYGMTQGSMGIVVSNIEEAIKIKNVLISDKFSNFLKSVMWSNFRIDWRLFSYLKKDFWKEF
jgi:hypothetical protein